MLVIAQFNMNECVKGSTIEKLLREINIDNGINYIHDNEHDNRIAVNINYLQESVLISENGLEKLYEIEDEILDRTWIGHSMETKCNYCS